MDKELFGNFIKDRFILIVFYLFNMICIILFFHLSEPKNTEILYPLFISLFLLIVYLIIDWLKYYPFNKALKGSSEYLYPQTKEQKRICDVLNETKAQSTKKYYRLQERNNENLYFLSHFMHFLKTPVSVIALITSKEKNSGNSAVLEKIERENKRLHTSIDQALTMVRMEEFEQDLEIRAIDIFQIIRKIVNDRKRECIYHHIFPVIECKEEQISVVSDTKWIDILLDQVISNAIKYSSLKEGKKKLRFNIEKQKDTVKLSVSDEGIGIPPYDIDRIFDPFFTGENGRKTFNSSGIGLYICKKIAVQLGHHLSVHSEVDRGTTIVIQFKHANEL